MLEKWTQLWLSLRAPLAHLPIVGDLGPYAALTLVVWAVVWAVRRYRPAWWARLLRLGIDPEGALSHFVQAAPGAIIGALWAGGTTLDVEQAAYGLLAGLGSALLHHVAKLVPGPYRGALKVASLELWECTRCGCLWRPVEGEAGLLGDSWKLHDANQVPCSKCDNSSLFRDIIRKVGGVSLLLLACVGCGYNAQEVKCLATVEVPEDVAIAECDQRNGGKCPDDELDAIMDPNDIRAENCIKEN